MQLDHIESQLSGSRQNILEAGVHEEADSTDRIWNRLDNRIGLTGGYIPRTFREEVETDCVGAGLNGLPAMGDCGDSADLDAKHRLLIGRWRGPAWETGDSKEDAATSGSCQATAPGWVGDCSLPHQPAPRGPVA